MQGQSRRMGLGMGMGMGIVLIMFVGFHTADSTGDRRVIDVEGGPESVIWVVQLSDLHFSVHHPERAIDFKNLLGPALSVINPALVLITGDLTDGKSKDLLTMKQNENEWVEYQSVMDDVVTRSGLDKSIFYDLRGNHDNFGTVSASLDFFSNYSINAHFARKSKLNSVTIQTAERKHLFVGIDTTSSVGVRGPTNLFGHPTDEFLDELDSELSQWNSVSTKPVTKISFGHFPLSFSAYTSSGKSLKEIFLKHSISVYLCGHLHTRFGKNLKRYHRSSSRSPSQELFQLNMHQKPLESNSVNCSFGAPQTEEFWEWEMGDWRKSRAMRILGIDRGLVSYVDIDFQSGAKKTIILPTFPLDSRYMSTSSSLKIYDCQLMVPASYETVRALVFSFSPIVSVVARVYDSISGNHIVVLEVPMIKHVDKVSSADLYIALWNYRAFEDPSPDRYWLQIESTDVKGRSTLSDLRPFSLNGLGTEVSWTWKEFFVMGCQWANLYYPILWSALSFILFILIGPKFFLAFSRKQYSYKDFAAEKPVLKFIAWVLQDFCKIHVLWFGTLVYVLYLVLCPWFLGQVFTDEWNRGYMTYMGWVVKIAGKGEKHDFIGFPDIMVVVLSHLFNVVLPTIFISIALSAERGIYREGVLSLSRKKEDDHRSMTKKSLFNDLVGGRRSKFHFGDRWIRKLLLLLCFAICWKHFQSCRALMKAYDMNPFLHFPVYSMAVPALLACGVYKTRSFDDNEYKHE